tara:strand:- start:7662 stop:7976 length:315 start_codon:yes stop_codon:yes gene_type:complete
MAKTSTLQLLDRHIKWKIEGYGHCPIDEIALCLTQTPSLLEELENTSRLFTLLKDREMKPLKLLIRRRINSLEKAGILTRVVKGWSLNRNGYVLNWRLTEDSRY